ncbi:charged multivesicular body protein 7 isoform X1 [Prunus yedoensis var. nudiflora]|uniref:Charged multivesicular body protein 7 isoform X1 n=1 Tax=Prunus yedoensis var. nudiflora TaxID=2094558 RepID=A0A314Z3L5_PRUYE|nr:charged multivesicular body protein 7 isoform X1 [Prunus yedoensis var. nudiflora]
MRFDMDSDGSLTQLELADLLLSLGVKSTSYQLQVTTAILLFLRSQGGAEPMSVDTGRYLRDDQTSNCRSFGSINHPSSQLRKISIGIMVDQLAKKKSGVTKEGEVVVPNAEMEKSNMGNNTQGKSKEEEFTASKKAKQMGSSTNLMEQGMHHLHIPLSFCKPNLVFKSDGKKQNNFDRVTYQKKEVKDGAVEVQDFTFETAKEVIMSDKEVLVDKAVATEGRRTETLRMKLWEILGTVSSPDDQHSKSQIHEDTVEEELKDSPLRKTTPDMEENDAEDGLFLSSSEERDLGSCEEGSPIIHRHDWTGEDNWIEEPSEPNQVDGLARAVELFALELEKLKTKLRSATNRKSSEILMSVAGEVHMQLQMLSLRFKRTCRGKLTNLSKSKRKRLESRFEEQQEHLKVIYDKFKEQVNQHLQDCRSTLEGLEVYQTEFKGTVEKQKASHRKLLLQVEEAIETQLNDAQRRIQVMQEMGRGKMLQLKHELALCLKEGFVLNPVLEKEGSKQCSLQIVKKMEESERVREVIRKQVGDDWDDEVMSRARFKALSGQRSDWEPTYLFWRDLILSVARQLGLFIIKPSHLNNQWFNRGGLTPLSLDRVLFEMYNEGEIVLPSVDLVDPTAGRLSQIFTRLTNSMIRRSRTATPQILMSQDRLILTSLLKDKAVEVVKLLSECHWTSSCIVTMKRFQDICGGAYEASALLSHLSAQGKARYLSLSKGDFIEGVKVSLSASSVPSISSLDCDVLHLIWTTEKLQQQLNVIDQRCQTSRKSALACLNSGNKKVALRHVRQLKLANESRENCAMLLNRVEEVLDVIASAESTKKVSEAIQIGAQAIKENKMSVEEVQHSLQEIEESIDTQKQIENALESTSLYTVVEDEESIEEEFKKLELDIEVNSAGETEASKSAESLIDSLSNLKLVDDGLARTPAVQGTVETIRNNKTETPVLETA